MGRAAFARLVASSRSITHVFDQLQLRKSGAYYRIFRAVVAEMEIDTSHFIKAGDLTVHRQSVTRPLEEIFLEDSSVSSSTLRGKIIRHQLLPHQCAKCDNKGEWLGQPIVLQIDHINGKRRDNRIENLRFLCPNCHSQTETFCGRRHKTKPRCPDCGKPYRGAGRRCRRCSHKLVKRACTIQWPAKEIIAKLVWDKSLSAIGADLMCSETAVRKYCKRNGIAYPPVGYWERRRRGYSHEQALLSQKRARGNPKRVTPDEVEQAKLLMQGGHSLRKAANAVGCSHQTLLIRLKGDPVLLLTKHRNAKHNQTETAARVRPLSGLVAAS